MTDATVTTPRAKGNAGLFEVDEFDRLLVFSNSTLKKGDIIKKRIKETIGSCLGNDERKEERNPFQ